LLLKLNIKKWPLGGSSRLDRTFWAWDSKQWHLAKGYHSKR